MEDSFTRAIHDKFPMYFQDSDIRLRDATITCSDSNSGTFSAVVAGSNAVMIVANIQLSDDDFTVDLGNGLSVLLTPCKDTMCTAESRQHPEGQSSGLVAGVVISVIFLVAMVIAAAVLVTMIIFKYR
jgi:hypothetical protein